MISVDLVHVNHMIKVKIGFANKIIIGMTMLL